MRRILSVFVVLAMVFSQSLPAFAASDAWVGTTNALWATTTNWSPSVSVPGSGDTATFSGAGNGNTTINLGGGVTVNTIAFTTGTAAYTIGTSGAQSLTLNDSGAITMASGVANNEVISAGLTLGTDATSQNVTITNNNTNSDTLTLGAITGSASGGGLGSTTDTLVVNGSANTTVSGIISNSSNAKVAVTQSGTGTLTLSNTNTYTGGTTLSSGILVAVGAQALGTSASALTINGSSTLDLQSNTTAYNTVISGSGNTVDILSDNSSPASGATNTLGTLSIGADTLQLEQGINVSSGTAFLTFGAVTLTASGAIFETNYLYPVELDLGSVTGAGYNFTANNVQANDTINITGNITTGSGSVTQEGAGILILEGNNTYTGGTIITGGTLIANSTSALGTSASVLSMSGGTLDIQTDTSISAYNTTITGNATIDSDKATPTSAGITQTLGTLSIGANTLTIGKGVNVTSGTAGLTFGAVTLTASGAVFAPASGTLLTLGSVSGSGYNFTVNGAGNADITGIIGTGSGSVTKSGSGTLILGNSGNTYAGATTITGGELQFSAAGDLGNASGTNTIAISNAAILDSTSGTNTLVANRAITIGSGGGTLQADAGTLTVNGTVAEGSGNLLTVTGAGNVTINGLISGTTGASGVDKTGSGTLTLTDASNSYAGTTAITGGELKFSAAGDLGNASATNVIDISNNSILDSTSGNNTLAANQAITMGGGGATLQADAGTLTVNGAIANGGTLLTVAGAGNTTINGLISGTGGLTKSSTGTLTLTGSNNYSGATTINSGATVVAGSASALGTGAGGVTNNGTLNIGTESLVLSSGSSSYAQAAGSSLDLTANSSSVYGSITTHAAAVLANNTVNVTVGGYIPNNAVLTIIDPPAGVSGVAPATVTSTSSFVSFVSSISNSDLILTANHSSTGFAAQASNSNAAAIGNVLDNETSPSSDLTNILNTLEASSPAQVTAALNTLSPQIDRGIMDSTNASLNNFIGASIDRTNTVLGLAKSSGVSAGDKEILNGLWAKQYGGYLTQGTLNGIQGYDAWSEGTAVGIDHLFNDNLTIGVSLGYGYGEVNSDTNNANTNISSFQGTLYGGYQATNVPYYVDFAGSVAENWYNGNRDVTVDAINRIADAQYRGTQTGIYLEGGYKYDLGNNLSITPLTSLQWTHLYLNSYGETNAGDLSLNVNSQSYDILESGLGASISYPVKYGWCEMTPELHAKWLYDLVAQDMSVTSSFTGGGASFTTTGAAPARSGANVGGKLTFDLKNDISVVGQLDTEMKDQYFGISGSVSVRYKF